jgi:CubicO group peptidase (beta-lactamase class C family)
MRLGLGCSDAVDFWNQSNDWVKATLDYPVVGTPGTSFNYCTELTHVLGALIANAAGEPLEDFAASRLFQPLSMSPVEWHFSPTGRAISGFEFWMAPRDMIKLGQLVLDGGTWNGRQIVSPSWLRNTTLQRVTVDSELGYGYQWWTRYFGSEGNWQYGVVAWGNGGRFILVFKDLDLVVGLTGGNYNSDQDRQGFTLVDEYVIPAVQ